MKLPVALYVNSGYPFLWVKTDEYSSAMNDCAVSILRSNPDSVIMTWNMVAGLRLLKYSVTGNGAYTCVETQLNEQAQAGDALACLMHIKKKLTNKGDNRSHVLILEDFHLFIKNPVIWRTLLNMQSSLSTNASSILFLSPVTNVIPEEFEDYVSIYTYELPSKRELVALTRQVINDTGVILPSETTVEDVANAGLGMSRNNFFNAMYLASTYALNARTELEMKIIYSQKENMLQKDALVTSLKTEKTFANVCGLHSMKGFTRDMIASKLGRGILILGVPGSGKSLFASTLGNEMNRPVLSLDFASLMGGVVGETESKTEKALKMVDAMQPCILFIDEIEKGLAGTSGMNGDSGTSKRQGSLFLKWLNDHTSDVYVVATANSLEDLPAEYLRAERWDAIFFVDLPDSHLRNELLQMYTGEYGLQQVTDADIDIAGWTGAEIKALCRIAKARGISLESAKHYVVPIIKSAAKKLDKLREYADSFAVSADEEDATENSVGLFSNRNVVTLQ